MPEAVGAPAARESVPGTVVLLLVCWSQRAVPFTVCVVAEFGFAARLSTELTTLDTPIIAATSEVQLPDADVELPAAKVPDAEVN